MCGAHGECHGDHRGEDKASAPGENIVEERGSLSWDLLIFQRRNEIAPENISKLRWDEVTSFLCTSHWIYVQWQRYSYHHIWYITEIQWLGQGPNSRWSAGARIQMQTVQPEPASWNQDLHNLTSSTKSKDAEGTMPPMSVRASLSRSLNFFSTVKLRLISISRFCEAQGRESLCRWHLGTGTSSVYCQTQVPLRVLLCSSLLRPGHGEHYCLRCSFTLSLIDSNC